MKEFCSLYSKRRARRKKDTINFWFAYLKVCVNDRNWSEVSRVKENIRILMLEGASGHQVRSRFANNATEEVSTLFHANMEAKNANKNSLNRLKVDGKVVEDQAVVEEEILAFFQALFNGHHDANLKNTGTPFVPNWAGLESYLDVLTPLPNDERDSLSTCIDVDDLRYIISNCPNNKSPGLDSISYEFYKSTMDIIQYDLLEVFQCQLDRMQIVSSNKQGVTRLLPKVKGVPTVQDLRPITLLNSDYKILSKW